MTVKRRLYISNILMIVIPVLLNLIMGAVVIKTTVSLLGIQNNRDFEFNANFSRAVAHVQRFSDNLASTESIAEYVNSFGSEYGEKGITLAVYQNGTLLQASGELADNTLVETVLSSAGNQRLILDDTIIQKIDTGAYTALLSGRGYFVSGAWHDNTNWLSAFTFFFIFFSVLITTVLVTNGMLTHMVYKSIVTPLDLLVYGVHQLRDGNLEYRIAYAGKDEFADICGDFNEMAGHLLEMVNARQKDDENRRELIAGISHDLRTPLTSIKAYIEGLERGIAATPAVQKRYLNTIKNKTADLEYIVTQLFRFSKLDIGEFPFQLENVDIGREIIRFIDSISNEYEGKGLLIAADEIEAGLHVSADIVQLRNVFINILENSVKYGKNGMIRVDCKAVDQKVRITLTDNGPGVTDEALPNLFSVFYRGDKARTNPSQGSGLGLAITAKIIERIGGSIRAENAAEGGLRIVITLPLITGGTEVERDTDC